MGQRTVKRVPIDFDHPLGEVWPGYLSPQVRPCPADCLHGYTTDGDWLSHWVHLLLVAATNPTHPWLAGVPLAERPPTPRLAEVTEGLAGRAPGTLGHDALDRWEATRAILVAAGLPEDWGVCPTCEGHGYHPDDHAEQEAWEPTEPPTGDGWQLWETTSEGSPKSPVFATPEALAEWCAENATVFGHLTATYDEWLTMFLGDTVDVGSTLVANDPRR